MGDLEGDYMAAMRGSNSKQWQSMHSGESAPKYSSGGVFEGFNPGGGPGVCYRCKNPGHWARECPMAPPPVNPDINPAVPEKQCPCGAGACAVRTSNTAKNPGRQFYVCPKPQDAGKCNFFEWCDAPAPGSGPVAGAGFQQPSGTPEMKCPSCGHPCAVLTAKTDKNLGRKFYKCQKAEGCNTFKWCDEFKPGDNTISSGSGHGYKPPASTGNLSGGYPGYGGGGYNSSADTSGYTGYSGNSAQPPWSNSGTRPGNCYKCGGAGHYANACPVRR